MLILSSSSLLRCCSMALATPYANISASFVVQQFGLPSLTRTTEDGEERWNGVLPSERLEKLRGRMSPRN